MIMLTSCQSSGSGTCKRHTTEVFRCRRREIPADATNFRLYCKYGKILPVSASTSSIVLKDPMLIITGNMSIPRHLAL